MSLLIIGSQTLTKIVFNKSFINLMRSFLFAVLFGATTWAQNSNNSYIIDANLYTLERASFSQMVEYLLTKALFKLLDPNMK